MNRRDAIKQTALIMGYAVSASAVAGVMAGCQASETSNWIPVFLSKDQGNLVAEIAERILPASDTPGATDVNVHGFIDLMLKDYLDEEEVTRFMAGLSTVDQAAQSMHKKKFAALEAAQQDEVLMKLATEAEGKREAFFNQIKQLTVLGYFSSELVGEQYLNYDPIPGDYIGCVPLEEVGNVNWSI